MTNISISASGAVWDASGQFDTNLTGRVSSYSHEIQAFGGFWSADVDLSVGENQAETWLSHGLGRHIVSRSPGLSTMFEGFANRISWNIGSLSIEVGPLLGIANKVAVAFSSYSPIGGSGIQIITDYAEDLASQALYGVISVILSASGTSEAEAESIRDVYLAENAWPKYTQSISTGGEGNSSSTINLEVMGYVHWLGTYPYINISDPFAYVNLSDKIASIIAACPTNNVLSTNTANIETNTMQMPEFERDDAIAMELIKGMVGRGNTSALRTLFGIYENRVPYYSTIPTEPEYEHSARANKKAFYLAGTNQSVFNGLVRPGKLVKVRDIGKGIIRSPGNYKSKSNNMFLERVVYNGNNNTLDITSSQVSTFEQVMAAYGSGSM